jgi:predicted nucleotidyltransferase
MMTEQVLKQTIRTIIRKYLGDSSPVKIFLFGSRATRQHTARSDYDLGIEVDGPILFELIGRIQADPEELPILQKIEVVDFGRVSEDFKKEALAVIEEW